MYCLEIAEYEERSRNQYNWIKEDCTRLGEVTESAMIAFLRHKGKRQDAIMELCKTEDLFYSCAEKFVIQLY